jgi:ribA/ribD-fused uncharacterized protein
MAIDSFTGDFDFLSNFYIEADGLTLEHNYQASKTLDWDWIFNILKAETPGRAKRLGQKAPIRSNWEQSKVEVMVDLVRKKFKDPELSIKLIDTFAHELIEGNKWHDNFWGKCSCMKCRDKEKSNMLGFILMKIRDELLEKD